MLHNPCPGQHLKISRRLALGIDGVTSRVCISKLPSLLTGAKQDIKKSGDEQRLPKEVKQGFVQTYESTPEVLKQVANSC